MLNHNSVLLYEAVKGLNLRGDGVYIDGTFGMGGHSKLILSYLGQHGRLLAIDRDPKAVDQALSINDPRFLIIHGVFSRLISYVHRYSLMGGVDGILLDLGLSSAQLDDVQRGFSFMCNGPLDMRMDPTVGISATQWLKHAKEEEIAWVLKTYGEERYARRIARAISTHKQKTSITTTHQLVNLIIKNTTRVNKHPATRCFQAIRIHLNEELQEIQSVLNSVLSVLAPHGRLVVISFHSGEDRLVKNFIRKNSTLPQVPRGLPLTEEQRVSDEVKPKLIDLGKILPSPGEIAINPRSRSAVLRIAEKLGD